VPFPPAVPPLPDMPSRRAVLRTAAYIGAGLAATVGAGAIGAAVRGEPSTDQVAGLTVVHGLGETVVPFPARRVVALDPYAALQVAVAGRVPVVGVVPCADGRVPSFLPADSLGRPKVLAGRYRSTGTPRLDLRLIKELKPDLVIGTEDRVQDEYGPLSTIAPTVALEKSSDWWVNVRRVADVYGVRSAVEPGLAAYRKRVTRFRFGFVVKIKKLAVGVIHPLPEGMALLTDAHPAGRVLTDAGVTRPPNQRRDPTKDSDPAQTTVLVPYDRMREADADVLIVVDEGPKAAADKAYKTLTTKPGWTSAVRRRRTCSCPTWSGSSSR
jgi:ABC-type Fe3+-hydroxamate transport system substrate-binding protein